MLLRLSAYASLVLGIWGALAVLTTLGAGLGLALGAVALVCGAVALTERPAGHVRRAALIGVATGAFGIVGFLVWVILAALGV
jgi:Na+-transporting NADH:ubiquinone oxidoreductase subunit NqrD